MEVFIGFFDILGFKEIIKNKKLEDVSKSFRHLLKYSQSSVSGDELIDSMHQENTQVPDLSKVKVNCLHFSDSIIFWTNSDTSEDFKDLFEACYSFYKRTFYDSKFYLRGCLVHGKIDFVDPMKAEFNGKAFYNYSILGQGIIDAYQKAESINYAGCILDSSILNKVDDEEINRLIEAKKIFWYNVPYKIGTNHEYVLRLRKNINEEEIENTVPRIRGKFYNPSTEESKYPSQEDIDRLNSSVKEKMNNTIDFVKAQTSK